MSLRSAYPSLEIKTYITDLRDGDRTTRIVGECSCDIIYHAAAHKHVHYMERDPAEAVVNNVAGSINLIKAAEAHGVVAVRLHLDRQGGGPARRHGRHEASHRAVSPRPHAASADGCRFITVRFGNVIGSTGSVVPLFLKQIRRGGPVTVSDPRATRYFMTLREAALLVIRASVIGSGGETFILDMGEALNMLEVAQDLIILSGHEPETEIPIVITGLRDGERLHERLVAADEELVPLGEEKLLLARSSLSVPDGFEAEIESLIALARKGDTARLLAGIAALIPAFGAPEDGADDPRACTGQ